MQKPILILMLIIGLASGCSAPASRPSPVPPPPGLTATSFFENVEVTATESAPIQTVLLFQRHRGAGLAGMAWYRESCVINWRT